MPIRQALEEASREGPPFSVALFIGPEGGFTAAEVEMAHGYGILPVSLGPRILRAETAAIVAVALVQYALAGLPPG
jgi:16S rRNA (uracil1498-N3)-methyltransferase